MRAILTLRRPARPDELPSRWRPHPDQEEQYGPYTWDTSVFGHPPVGLPDVAPGDRLEGDMVAQIAAAASMDSVDTFRDALTAMHRLGLLATCDAPELGLIVPNPMPRPVWEVLPLSQSTTHLLQTEALNARYRVLEPDIQQLLEWAPQHTITTTVERIAVRLSVSGRDVLGVIGLLTHLGTITVSSDDASLTYQSVITLSRARR